MQIECKSTCFPKERNMTKEKKCYVAPSVEVVCVELQGSLLDVSGVPKGNVENGKLNGFDDDWD